MMSVRQVLTFALLSLLVAGCRPHKVSLGQQVAGTWTVGKNARMTLSADGSFLSTMGSSDRPLAYKGTWLVEDQTLVMSVTNVTANSKHESVGSIDRVRIAQVDADHLTLEMYGQTNYWEREQISLP